MGSQEEINREGKVMAKLPVRLRAIGTRATATIAACLRWARTRFRRTQPQESQDPEGIDPQADGPLWFRRSVCLIAQSTLSGRLAAIALGVTCTVLVFALLNAILYAWIEQELHMDLPDSSVLVRGANPENMIKIARYSPDSACIPNSRTLQQEDDASILDIVRYTVTMKDGERSEPVMMVEFWLVERRGGLSLSAHLAKRKPAKSPGDGNYEWEPVEWWTTGGLAKSNNLIFVPNNSIVRSPVFDTTPNSLVTWIKSNWVKTVKAGRNNSDESGIPKLSFPDIRDGLCPELERLLGEDLADLQTRTPLVLQRTLGGWIQFITITAFFAMLAIVLSRYKCIVGVEKGYISFVKSALKKGDLALKKGDLSDKAKLGENISRVVDTIAEKEEERRCRWGPASFSSPLRITRGALSAVLLREHYGDVPSFLDSFSDLEDARLDRQRFFVRFLIGAMPALGFIGTVIGIPDALMGTGKVLSDQLAKQQSGVTGVALSLAFAFDTTLVALVLALIGQFLYVRLASAEEGLIHKARDFCLQAFVNEGHVERDLIAEEMPASQRPDIDRKRQKLEAELRQGQSLWGRSDSGIGSEQPLDTSRSLTQRTVHRDGKAMPKARPTTDSNSDWPYLDSPNQYRETYSTVFFAKVYSTIFILTVSLLLASAMYFIASYFLRGGSH